MRSSHVRAAPQHVSATVDSPHTHLKRNKGERSSESSPILRGTPMATHAIEYTITEIPAPPGRAILRRIWTALENAGRRRAQREIAAFIVSRGGRVTDNLERDIAQFVAMRGLR